METPPDYRVCIITNQMRLCLLRVSCVTVKRLCDRARIVVAVLFVVAVIQIVPDVALGDSCLQIRQDQTLKMIASPRQPTCAVVRVDPGEASQITVDQPEDLIIRIHGGAREAKVDAFDFGPETVTLSVEGTYRIEVLSESTALSTPLLFNMSRKALALQEAAAFETAELQTTKAKISSTVEDINEARRLWSDIGDRLSVARTNIQLGVSLHAAGNLLGAQKAFEEAFALCQATSHLRCSAEAANNSGVTARRLGDFDTSVKRLMSASEGWRRISSRVNEGKTLSNLGLIYVEVGDYQQGMELYDRARAILQGRDSLAYARVLNNIGLCYQLMAEYGQAMAHFGQALATYTRLGSSVDAAGSRLNVGRTLMLEGRLSSAQATLIRTLRDARTLSRPGLVADTLNNLGQTLWRRHLSYDAQAPLKEAMAIDDGLGDRRGYSSALHYLGLAAIDLDDLDLAYRNLRKAADVRLDCGLRDDAADSLFALAELEFGARRYNEAQQLALQAVKLLETVRSRVPGPALRASFYMRKRKYLDLLVRIAMRPDNPNAITDGLFAAERGRGRALLDLLAEGAITGPQTPELIRRRTKIQRQVDLLSYRLASSLTGDNQGLRREIQALLAEDDEVEVRIRQQVTEEPGAKPLDSLESLQRHIPLNGALLEYHLGDRQSYLWLVTANDARMFELPPRAVVNDRAKSVVDLFGRINERRSSPDLQKRFELAIRRLSATLLSPLAGAMDTRTQNDTLSHTLILVLDGSLHRVPFAALRLPNSVRPLGIAYNLIQAPSAGFLSIAKPPRPVADYHQSILALADPVFSPGDARVPERVQKSAATTDLPRLPFTGELNTIMHLVPSARRQVLRGFDVNPETLRSLRLQDFAILHFSTHAVIDDRTPELSRVALSMLDRSGRPVNGFLRPYQLAALPLRESVVVLSACDTALGKELLGEGLLGFTGSLFQAGASQLVLSLTKVDAQASSVFFSGVYERMFNGERASAERAMTLTRRLLFRSERWSDPYYWSSFVIIGSPTDTR